ncbi:alpha-1-antitrypsin homolog [Esox lucius]|uniref:Serpin domain-containing protein n=1 Tax=Esox lucius TaxID=8010 RepID=A0A3P8ZV69_ESOLU|nr:alpha-1-antitrypsin homolog [Esox lucius]
MQGISCCAIAAVLLCIAWAAPHDGDHAGHTEELFHHLHHAAGETHPKHSHGEESCHLLTPHNADFAFALYKSLSKSNTGNKNVFFSPLGISTSLAMLSLGAKGDTHSQLFSALGYTGLAPEKVNEAFEHLNHMLGHTDEAMQLDMGNAVALREGFKPEPKFLEDAKHFYASEGFTVDYRDPALAAAEINKYIAEKTADKIKDLVKDLDPETAMVLINYVFFRGKWDKPFDAKHTQKAEFHVDESTKVEVDMMMRSGRYEMYQDQTNFTTVVLLPYRGNASMMVILPDEGKMAQVEAFINKEYLKHVHSSLYRGNVDIYMPKFSASTTYTLDDNLKEMGVVSAFSDAADLSGISEATTLKVSRVSHKAVLTVDEKGTEAAAATTIEIMPMSLPDTIKLNRPFLMYILEDTTKSIVFMGKITDPTAQ